METAEELAKRLGTTIMAEEQFIQLQEGVERKRRGITGMASRAIDDMTPAEVDDYVAERKARGEGLVGVVPPYAGHDNLVASDFQFRHTWDLEQNRGLRQKTRLVFINPDPSPELHDPDAVTFTPDDAIARVKERRTGAPITEVKAALMTLQEVHALLDHGTPPGRPGATPGALVCLVVIRGSFKGSGPAGRGFSPHSFSVAFEVCDSRNGHIFLSGKRTRDIILP